ncbi:hypothetical protein EVAR_61820_1 [Eumeta japonica]|uniref:Uncharacterized protein n=1 Tax=Eumeta variegata TaxID=151549 RepID=A0A4C1YYI4_EUMVA|nr:hypothetical protein EVAR_61820_1 [Eumeta japonica]
MFHCVTIAATLSIKEMREPGVCADTSIPRPIPTVLKFKSPRPPAVEARVVLKHNIVTLNGLSNGTMGVGKQFKWVVLRRDQSDKGEWPGDVLITYDDGSVGSRLKDSHDYVSIPPMFATFLTARKYIQQR